MSDFEGWVEWNGERVTEVRPYTMIRYVAKATSYWGTTAFRTSTMFRVWNADTGEVEFETAVSKNLMGNAWVDRMSPVKEGTYIFDPDYPGDTTTYFYVKKAATNPNPSRTELFFEQYKIPIIIGGAVLILIMTAPMLRQAASAFLPGRAQ